MAVGSAVAAGTAGAVHHHQEKKWSAQDAEAQQEQYEQEPYEQEYAPPPEQEAASALEGDLTAKLQELAKLHESGVLTDDEFAAAKQKLLAS